MARDDKRPDVVESDGAGGCSELTYSHPAFGVVTLGNPRGAAKHLFGSDVKHNECMSIEIKRAVMKRGLSNDWIHGRETLAVIELSHHQFAQFITSQGQGNGTPCTIRYCAPSGSGIEAMPGIEMPETKHETFRREIEESARESVSAISEQIRRLGEMIDSGKISKVELRKMHADLGRNASQLGGSLGFVVEQAQEALEKATTSAKIEVEAYISNAARRIGMQHLSQLGMIEDKSNDGNN